MRDAIEAHAVHGIEGAADQDFAVGPGGHAGNERIGTSAGVKPGMVYGETDELGYSIVEGKVSVRDLQTTILYLMGMDAHQFSYPFQGLNQRLIGPADEGQILKAILV